MGSRCHPQIALGETPPLMILAGIGPSGSGLARYARRVERRPPDPDAKKGARSLLP